MGRTHAWLLATAAAALIASAGTAQAYTINDTTLVWGYAGNPAVARTTSQSYGRWQDQIGVDGPPGFDTDAINVSYSGGSVIIDLITTMRLGTKPAGASPGDIWLDLDQNGGTGLQGFESAIVLERPYSPNGVNTPAVGLYDGTNGAVNWKTANDVWAGQNGTWGGAYCTTCSDGATSPAPGGANTPLTLGVITGGGTLVAGVGSGFSPNNFASGIKITLSGLSDAELALFQDGFRIGWGTGTCGNDTIVGSVPAVPVPAALPLMLSALGGLGLIARRRKAAAA